MADKSSPRTEAGKARRLARKATLKELRALLKLKEDDDPRRDFVPLDQLQPFRVRNLAEWRFEVRVLRKAIEIRERADKKANVDVEGATMDLSGLPNTALKEIAEVEVEAKYILRSEHGLYSTLTPEIIAGQETNVSSDGRNRAANHLFDVTARHLWEIAQPNVETFKAKLDAAKAWVRDKFHADPDALNEATASWLEWAREEVAAKHTGSESRKRPPVGSLSENARKLGQALREGRLEGYVEVPREVQTFVPRILGRSDAAADQSESAAPKVFVDRRHEKLTRVLDSVIAKIGWESFHADYPRLKRTPVFDYRAGKLKGKVGLEKRQEIEAAIRDSAARLGLSHSD